MADNTEQELVKSPVDAVVKQRILGVVKHEMKIQKHSDLLYNDCRRQTNIEKSWPQHRSSIICNNTVRILFAIRK